MKKVIKWLKIAIKMLKSFLGVFIGFDNVKENDESLDKN